MLPSSTKSDTAAPKTLTSVFHGFLFFQNPAPTEACAQLKKPPYEEDCRIPCPEECVLSAWTDWSSCPSNCLNSRINRRLPLSFRNRTLLALSSTAASGQNQGKEAKKQLVVPIQPLDNILARVNSSNTVTVEVVAEVVGVGKLCLFRLYIESYENDKT